MEDDERVEELSTITAIYPELVVDPKNPFVASLSLPIAPTTPLLVRFIPPRSSETGNNCTYADAATNGAAYIEHDVRLSHLPPLSLHVTLPEGYPADLPAKVQLKSENDWLPKTKLNKLEKEAEKLWEGYGHCQILFSYIDFLQQAALDGFDLDQEAEGCFVLPVTLESALTAFDRETKLAEFKAGTFDCGVCLEPKKGSACYKLERCGHVFCRTCLQDFYNNAINEGDVVNVRCIDPGCGKEPGKKKRKRERTLHPRELLAMGIENTMVRRYVEMKRKKRLETDKTTVYCPREWCQGAARNPKFPPIPANLADYPEISDSDSDSEATGRQDSPVVQPDPNDRLAVCEKCQLAFCRVCYAGWHGSFQRCHPRDPNELTEEEKASYDYIRMNTSPCPTCSSPTQKTMGCNHMKCFQCNTHFCYLCGAWLEEGNPYQHFNQPGRECYQRLWELEEGDEGQGPEDGRGFAGGRRWEQMALEIARAADEEEAAAAALAAQQEEDARAVPAPVLEPPAEEFVVAMAQVQINENQPRVRAPRRAQNPFPRPVAEGQAAAVRAHERAPPRGPRGGQRGGQQGQQRQQNAQPTAAEQRAAQEVRRFVEMAQRDEEDGWDSDELGDEDGWVIR